MMRARDSKKKSILRMPLKKDLEIFKFEHLLVLTVIIFQLSLSYHYSFVGGDIDQDVSGAYAFRHNLSIYGQEGVDLYERDFERKGIQLNYHPPILSLLMIPFSFIDSKLMFNIWNIISLFCLITSFNLLFKNKLNEKQYYLLLSAFLISYPVVSNIANAQLSPIVFLLISLSYKFLNSKKEIYSGVMIAFASLLKLYPVMFSLILLKKKHYKGFISFLLTFFLIQISVFYVVRNDFFIFVKKINEGSSFYAKYLHNVSLNSLFSIISQKLVYLYDLPEYIGNLCKIAYLVLALIFLVYFLLFLSSNRSIEYLYALISIFVSLFTPIFWEHGLILGLFVVLYLLKEKFNVKNNLALFFSLSIMFYFPNVFISLYLYASFQDINLFHVIFSKLITLALIFIAFYLLSFKRSKDFAI